jgi:hypothetical protein
MTIVLDVFKTRRLHFVRFERATTGNPQAGFPDPDDRGHLVQFGPVVGVLQGRQVTVRLRRVTLETATPLFLKSSDTGAFTVDDPADGNVPASATHDFKITGVTGGNPRTARLEVRHRDASGPILASMEVRVFQPAPVTITPHMVTIAQTGAAGPGVGSAVTVSTIMDLVKAIWIHHGVTINVGATVNDNLTFAQAGTVAWGAELNTLLGTNWVPATINAYFVNRINMNNPAQNGVLGLGFSRTSFSTFGLPNPGIVLGDTNMSGASRVADLMWLANDLAHEVGHFFTLWHPENQQGAATRRDTWSRRMLMHNFNLMGSLGGHRDDTGYGNLRRGCFVTMKDLPQLVTDGESGTARGTITSPAGPY